MIKVGDVFMDLNLNTKPFDSQIKTVANSAQNTMAKAFGGLSKIVAGAFAIKQIAAFTNSCVSLGSDLAEVQNVVDVVFPNMNEQVNAFAQNAIGAFGLSETVAKRMTGTYGSMAKAFGFTEKASYDMATSLTGLAGDVASFYNLDPTEAYTKLKSVFSGETETLKDLGIVMTQSALDQYALANGFGKTTSQMSEQEKVSLRLAFVTQQLSAAGGDFARTSDSWANKVRVLSLNFDSLKASIGQGFINLLSPLITLLNNVIVKLQSAAKYFAAFTALITGNKKTSTSLGSVSSTIDTASAGASTLADNVAGVTDNAKKAAKAVGVLAGFDDIKNLSTSSTDSSGSSGGSGSNSGFGNDFDAAGGTEEALSIDTSGMEKSINKVKTIWLNFTNFLTKNKAIILSLIGGIMAGFLTFETLKNWATITKGIGSIGTTLKTVSSIFSVLIGSVMEGSGLLTGFQLAFGTVAGTAALVAIGVASVTAALLYLYQTSDSFRKLVNEAIGNISAILNSLFNKVLKPIFSFLLDVFNTIIIPIATFIATVFVKAVEGISTIILSFWNNVLAPLAKFLVDILAVAIEGIIEVWTKWKPIINVIFIALKWLWDSVLAPIADFIVGSFSDSFKSWGDLINKLIPDVKKIFEGFITFLVGVFTLDINKVWSGIRTIFEGFSSFLKGAFTNDWTRQFGVLGVPLNYLLSHIKSVWESIKGIFNGITTFVSGVFSGNWKKAWQGVKTIFYNVVSGLANIFKSPINAIIDGINSFIRSINKIKVPDWVPGVGGLGFNIGQIPKLADGGYVRANTPQLAMIGDNKTQGEIVSPEGKMYEVMLSALQAYGARNASNEDIQVLVSIMYEILDAIKNLKLVVDGDSLNDDGKKRDKERALRTGKLITD